MTSRQGSAPSAQDRPLEDPVSGDLEGAVPVLVLLSAAGIFVMSRSVVPPGDGPIPFHRVAVARNMVLSIWWRSGHTR